MNLWVNVAHIKEYADIYCLLLQKLMEGNKEEVSLLDSSLTSLSWLQNLRVHDLISPPTLVASVSPSPDRSSSPKDSTHCRSSYGISLSPIKKCLLQSADFKKHPRKYCTNTDKPPFSYSTLLYLAIVQSKTGKATLNEIYRWIKDNFLYYHYADAGWQVSKQLLSNLIIKFCVVVWLFRLAVTVIVKE